MSKELNFKEIEGGIEYNGRVYTLDQKELEHKILKEIVDRLIKLEGKLKIDTEFITSNEFSNIMFSCGGSAFGDVDDGSTIKVEQANGISFTVNGRTAVTDYRTAKMVEKEKAVPVKIVSKEKVTDTYTDKKSLTKDEKKQYENIGFVVVIE